MNRKYTNRSYLDALEKKVLVFDGAMGTSLQNQHLTAEHFGGEQYNGCNDYLVISFPEAVEKVHRSFLEVGVDVIETNTFRSNQITMKEYKLQDRVIEINETAARLARQLADEYSNVNHRTSLCCRFHRSSGKLPSASDPELSNVSFDELADVFREQAVGLIRGGVDVLLIETSQDILEVKAAITGIHKAFDEFKSICRSRLRSRSIRPDACCSARMSRPRLPSSKVSALMSSVSTVPPDPSTCASPSASSANNPRCPFRAFPTPGFRSTWMGKPFIRLSLNRSRMIFMNS